LLEMMACFVWLDIITEGYSVCSVT
jgi:hypothetical protein